MAAKGNFPSCLAYKKILNSPTYEVSRCFHSNPLQSKTWSVPIQRILIENVRLFLSLTSHHDKASGAYCYLKRHWRSLRARCNLYATILLWFSSRFIYFLHLFKGIAFLLSIGAWTILILLKLVTYKNKWRRQIFGTYCVLRYRFLSKFPLTVIIWSILWFRLKYLY